MFERILVPLDGSPGAERVIPAAARIARAFGGSVILLSVVAPPVTPGKFSVPEVFPKAPTEEELAEATAYLRDCSVRQTGWHHDRSANARRCSSSDDPVCYSIVTC